MEGGWLGPLVCLMTVGRYIHTCTHTHTYIHTYIPTGGEWRMIASRPAVVLGYFPEIVLISSNGKVLWLEGVTGR